MSTEISKEQMAEYRRNWRKRQERDRQEMEARRERAWSIARQAAELLRNHFGATKILLFGSLARGDVFHAHSDVDLAAWGVDERQYYRAVSHLLDIDPDIEISLVRVEDASENMMVSIIREGVVI